MIEGEWNEKDLDRNIVTVCNMYGWARYHTFRSQYSPAGFPDLTLTRDGELIFAELKSPKKWPTEDQWCWLYDLQEVAERAENVEVWLLHPEDFDMFVDRLRQVKGDHL